MRAPDLDAHVRVALDLIGTRVDVLLTGARAPELAELVPSAWERCLAKRPVAAATLVVEAFLDDDESRVGMARDRGAVADRHAAPLMSRLSSALTVKAIEANFGELWMLHACAVADPGTGRSAVLVAPSGGGKTTAALTLGRSFGYLSDETVAIRHDGTILPYPKPLSVLRDGVRPKQQVAPSDLGLLEAPERPRLAAICLLSRTGSSPPTVEPVPTLEALPALAAQTSAPRLLSRPLHQMAEHLGRTGGLRRIRYREAEELLPLVAELIGPQ